jgi:NAD(P) transhydrogenase subunit beta
MTAGMAIAAVDLVVAFLFIYGLKQMASPVTARSGIWLAGAGMLAAVLISFLYIFGITPLAAPRLSMNLTLAVLALVLGVGWSWWTGSKVPMTAMPQMVAIYNGMGGGAAAAISAIALVAAHAQGSVDAVVAMLGGLIGSVSLAGSIIAWAKLDERLKEPWRIRGQQALNGVVILLALALGLFTVLVPGSGRLYPALFFAAALAFGVLMTLPIGGADMPVVISMYNAFTGLAVSLEGFVLQNPALMVAGMVVGSAGTLLTLLMAKAMNRSVRNVLFANFGAPAAGTHEVQGSLKPVDAADAGISMRYARGVVVVPGYGLAVAQAQHKLYEFVKLLQAAGVDVKFAVHPVAGRMPGHMDVLLAEAGVPYDLIYELDDINAEFDDTDVALVIGANDVVNPAARTDKSSPIYGMPILDVDHARQVYVVKRGQGKGYSGIENELFYAPNCNMVYGDAQAVLVNMIQAIKDLGLDAKAAA